MKYGKILRILAILITLPLLLITFPATPALAAGEYIDVTPNTGVVGDTIEIYGSYFSSGVQAKVYFSSDSAVLGDLIDDEVDTYKRLATVTAASDGTFIFNASVPSELTEGTDDEDVTIGTYYVYVTVAGSKQIVAKDTFTIESTGEITLNPDEGTVGIEVQITGEGFDKNEDITVKYDGKSTSIKSGDKDTDADGEFKCKIAIPESIAGKHTITVVGDDSDITAEAKFTVEPKITVTPESGAIGTTVTVSGTGFGDEVEIKISFGGSKVDIASGDEETDDDGSFDANILVPSLTSNTYDIEVEDDDDNSATAEFTIAAATFNIDPASGYVGTRITVSGSGFLASKPITITFDNASVANATSDATGSFSASFSAPSRNTGTYKVTINDGANTASADFEIGTSTTINPVTSAASPGYIGTDIAVSGMGFTVGGTVTVTYDGNQVATAVIGTDGNFSTTFKAPVSKGGNHAIIVTDGTNTRQFTFVMDSTPPSWPVPLKPEMGIKAETPVYFDWDDPTDPSGVTYSLQIATSADFSPGSMVLERTGLTASEYTLTEEEKLESAGQDNPYYWHVRAIDGAGNESEWSGTGEFYVGSSFAMSQATIYVIIGIGSFVLIILAFWLGRKTAYY